MLDTMTDTSADRAYLDPEARFMRDCFEASWRKACAFGNPQSASGRMTRMDLATPQSFVLQYSGPAEAHIRIAGKHFEHLLKDAPNGVELKDLFRQKSAATIMELVDAVFTLPAILSVPLISNGSPWRRPQKAELLILPLIDEQGKADHAIGIFVMEKCKPFKGLSFEIANRAPLRCEEIDQKIETFAPPAASKPTLAVSNT